MRSKLSVLKGWRWSWEYDSFSFLSSTIFCISGCVVMSHGYITPLSPQSTIQESMFSTLFTMSSTIHTYVILDTLWHPV
jgi:hypothetical protein